MYYISKGLRTGEEVRDLLADLAIFAEFVTNNLQFWRTLSIFPCNSDNSKKVL
jgi:hypothetical protein